MGRGQRAEARLLVTGGLLGLSFQAGQRLSLALSRDQSAGQEHLRGGGRYSHHGEVCCGSSSLLGASQAGSGLPLGQSGLGALSRLGSGPRGGPLPPHLLGWGVCDAQHALWDPPQGGIASLMLVTPG